MTKNDNTKAGYRPLVLNGLSFVANKVILPRDLAIFGGLFIGIQIGIFTSIFMRKNLADSIIFKLQSESHRKWRTISQDLR